MSHSQNAPNRRIEALLDVMARLRDKKTGCPWDLEQDFRSIAPYTIEEAYEVADAIERNDMAALKDELGDLLFQTVYHAQMGREAGHFDFGDVVEAIMEKMIRRHPHVFAGADIRTADQQTAAWEEQKAKERAAKGEGGILDDAPVGLPGLARAVKLQKRAARVGFDWPRAPDVLAKVEEELRELTEAAEQSSPDDIEEEFGDLLFALANLSRHLKVDPEFALRRANEKFSRRFRYIESALRAAGRSLDEAGLDEMESLWREAKDQEKTG